MKNLFTQSQVSKKVILTSILLTLFVGCKSGPEVTGCVSDPKANGFQCGSKKDNSIFIPYEKSTGLVCMSPLDIKDFLKGCRQHEIIQVSLCKLSMPTLSFHCISPSSDVFSITLDESDNYFCMTETDLKKLTCK